MIYRVVVHFLIRCRFPAGPRWSKINLPIAGSVISIFGRPHSVIGVNGTSMLIITVEDIVYNPGAAHIVDSTRSDSSVSASPRRLQVRRRKRAADALDSSPLSSPGGTRLLFSCFFFTPSSHRYLFQLRWSISPRLLVCLLFSFVNVFLN